MFWSRRVRGEGDEIISVREQKKVVNSDRLQFTIHDLEVDNSYLVQVNYRQKYIHLNDYLDV